MVCHGRSSFQGPGSQYRNQVDFFNQVVSKDLD